VQSQPAFLITEILTAKFNFTKGTAAINITFYIANEEGSVNITHVG
jgi:hypothetical protein